MNDNPTSNHLSGELSPYLLQHARQPVDWYPWNRAALDKAAAEDKPILLSIGYSACHWCHVMAHESFEDAEIADIMNAHFVNIKVDREERPDLDKIYQLAQQLLNRRSGGWPLTMFLTPQDQTPFFGGTYFPVTSQYGLPGFKELLLHIAALYRQRRDAISEQNTRLLRELQTLEPPPHRKTALTAAPLAAATQQLQRSFDAQHGGFGDAPKFPHTPDLEHLLRQHVTTQEQTSAALDVAELTLDKMALGGLYDHVGGGFYRYSVDRQWQIPHFEKMLYDNALLLALYSDAWRITRKPLHRRAAAGVSAWIMDEMQAPEGGYYSSLDADSEGQEGKFYVWDRDAIAALLDAAEYRAMAQYYGIEDAPNFEGRLHLCMRREAGGDALKLLASATAKLKQQRAQRPRPGCDDKILTSWNALMIKGMAVAALTFDDQRCLASAEKALRFISRHLYRDGKLYASYRNGQARLNAYLDDYAFLIDALLALLQCRWQQEWLTLATTLADELLRRFADTERGGFFFTAHDHEKLIQRGKPFMDDALPSGNGVAARACAQLGHLLGEPRYLRVAETTLTAAWSSLERHPSAHATLLHALAETLQPPPRTLLIGAAPQLEPLQLEHWRAEYRQNRNPYQQLFILPEDMSALPAALAEYRPRHTPAAYICAGTTCRAPIYEAEELGKALDAARRP